MILKAITTQIDVSIWFCYWLTLLTCNIVLIANTITTQIKNLRMFGAPTFAHYPHILFFITLFYNYIISAQRYNSLYLVFLIHVYSLLRPNNNWEEVIIQRRAAKKNNRQTTGTQTNFEWATKCEETWKTLNTLMN